MPYIVYSISRKNIKNKIRCMNDDIRFYGMRNTSLDFTIWDMRLLGYRNIQLCQLNNVFVEKHLFILTG